MAGKDKDVTWIDQCEQQRRLVAPLIKLSTMDWKLLVWILILSLARAEPQPSEGMFGEMDDLYGGVQMANTVPRLGRRSLSPFSRGPHRNGFRFFGGLGDNSVERQHSNLAGFFGPLFNRYENFRYYGGRPGEELARGLLRDKKKDVEEYPELIVADNVKLDKDTTSAMAEENDNTNSPEDQEYWKNILGEATINTVLEKMVS